MPTIHDTYSNALAQLARMTSVQVEALFHASVTGKPDKDTTTLLANVPDLVDQFGLVSAEVAAAYYDEARAAAGVPSGYYAAPSGLPTAEQVAASIRWAAMPLWADTPDRTAALDRLLGSSERLVLLPGRSTIINAASSDRVKVGWARHPEPGACGFCLMLASRGAVYGSKTSATTVGGRSSFDPATRRRLANGKFSRRGTSGRAFRKRGNQQIGESYHDHCRCTPTPVFEGQDVPEVNTRLKEVWRANKIGTTEAELQQTLVDAFRSWS